MFYDLIYDIFIQQKLGKRYRFTLSLMRLVANFSSRRVKLHYQTVIMPAKLAGVTAKWRAVILFSLRRDEAPNLAHRASVYHRIYIYHVRIHLRSRLDSRYKSSGNPGGGQRSGEHPSPPWIVSEYWTDVTLHVQMYERNVGEPRQRTSRIKNDCDCGFRIHHDGLA